MHLPLYKNYIMETIYWLQRLGEIHTTAWVVFWITIIFFAFGFISFVATMDDWCFDPDEDDLKVKRLITRALKTSSWIIGLSMLVGIFFPSEKDLYVIYGIGGTIDYIKSNDTAKQLPDKVVNAIDAWVDKQNKQQEND